MAWSPPKWIPKFLVGIGVDISNLYDIVIGWFYREINILEGHMLKIGVVGDLSLQDPQRLWRCLSAACASSDIVVQVGDCHPGYEQMKQAEVLLSSKFLAIPGNHDTDWDSKLGWPRFWYRAYQYGDGSPAVYLVGLDNSDDKFSLDTWPMLNNVPADGHPLIIFAHKPLSTIILPDGSESNHTMQEGGDNADAKRLMAWVKARQSSQDVFLVHGHLHSWSCQLNDYATCLLEGRGGAAGTGPGEIGWTSIIVTKEGLTWHKVDL